MPRSPRASDPKKTATRPAKSPVESSTLEGKNDWDLEQARRLLVDGYDPDRVADRTGFPRRVLESNPARRSQDLL